MYISLNLIRAHTSHFFSGPWRFLFQFGAYKAEVHFVLTYFLIFVKYWLEDKKTEGNAQKLDGERNKTSVCKTGYLLESSAFFSNLNYCIKIKFAFLPIPYLNHLTISHFREFGFFYWALNLTYVGLIFAGIVVNSIFGFSNF